MTKQSVVLKLPGLLVIWAGVCSKGTKGCGLLCSALFWQSHCSANSKYLVTHSGLKLMRDYPQIRPASTFLPTRASKIICSGRTERDYFYVYIFAI